MLHFSSVVDLCEDAFVVMDELQDIPNHLRVS